MSVYPVTPEFLKAHLFGAQEKDPIKIKICRDLAESLNGAYNAGKEDKAAGTDRKGDIIRLTKAAFSKRGALSFFQNRQARKILVDMMKEAYNEGFEGGEKA